MGDLLSIDEIQNLVSDTTLLTIVQNFLNAKTYISTNKFMGIYE